jgi:DNA-binding transcriptional regulator GbsR (MarR family)
VTEIDKATLRVLSDAAFGQKYRLELMLVIAANLRDPISLTDLAASANLGISQIQGAFRALVEVGLLQQVHSPNHRRKLYVADAESSAWRWAAEMRDRAA